MGLKDKWAESREREREARGSQSAFHRRLNKSAELRKLGVTSHSPDGLLNPMVTEANPDAMIAAERQRRSELYDIFVRAGTVITFPCAWRPAAQGQRHCVHDRNSRRVHRNQLVTTARPASWR